MKLPWIFCLKVLLNCYSVSVTGAPLDPAGQDAMCTPIQAVTSPSLLSGIEENSRVAPHGNDRHYTNGIMLSYTTGPLSEQSIWNAPTRWLGQSTFLFHPQTLETTLETRLPPQRLWRHLLS